MAAEHARKPTGLPTKPGTNACSPSKGRPSHRQRSVTLGYTYLEVKCLALQLLGCETHQTVALDVVRRPETTPIHELERYMRCKDCSEVRGCPYKRSHLVALRRTKISASDPLSPPTKPPSSLSSA
jgi:hypothetical protein